MEIWKDIDGFEGQYMISNYGRVKSIKTHRILKPIKTANGYFQVHLRDSKINKYVYIHRLVGQAFCNNPNNLNEINHLDENKENNRANNLIWCTHKENTNYGTRNERVSKKKKNNVLVSYPVCQYDKNGNLLDTYPSIAEASRQTGVLAGEISRATRGIYKTYKGYIWKKL